MKDSTAGRAHGQPLGNDAWLPEKPAVRLAAWLRRHRTWAELEGGVASLLTCPPQPCPSAAWWAAGDAGGRQARRV
jgi:hypothetical protein